MSATEHQSTQEILSFKVTNFNRVAATAGGFLSLFGLVSYLIKEKFYLGEALVSTIAGVIFSPHATNLIRPLEYAHGNETTLEGITLYFSRMVLGIQLVIAGIQMPSRYLRTEWKSLSLLLGPGMCGMWISTALLVWALVPDIPFIYALAVGSCVTPTDPVLSNSIVKGKFADKNIPKDLQDLIIAESGANDGLGYPFLFIALYLIKFTHDGGLGTEGGAGKAMGYWFGISWGYTIIMGTLYGAVVGWIFKVALHWAEERKYVDRESFLVFAVSIALFIVGTLGMIGGDDVLACFIAGNVFTWDDWFRLETKDDSFQPTIDMLLNVAIFAYYGAVCPWSSFLYNNVIPIYRLIFLGILVLVLRRLPIVLAMHKEIHQIREWRQALFVGYFGPIGVSAIFYLYTSREFLATIRYRHHERQDAKMLAEVFDVVVWFMVICSIIVHGISIPLGKLGLWLPRTLSRALSSENNSFIFPRAFSRTRSTGEDLANEGRLGRRPRIMSSRSEPVLPFRIQQPPVKTNDDSFTDENEGRATEMSHVGDSALYCNGNAALEAQHCTMTSSYVQNGAGEPPKQETSTSQRRPLFRIGGTLIREQQPQPQQPDVTDDNNRFTASCPISDVETTFSTPPQSCPPSRSLTSKIPLGSSTVAETRRNLSPGTPGLAPGTPGTPGARSIRFDTSPERDRGGVGLSRGTW